MIRGQYHIGLLLPIWPNQSVDLLAVNLIEGLDGVLDVLLGCLEVNDEDEGVVVLNLLHGALSREGELEDGVAIKLLGGGGAVGGKAVE